MTEIPDFQTIMLPLLRLTGDGGEHSLRDAIDALAKEFDLTKEQQAELLPSGRQAIFDNRVGWARTYMKKAGLLKSPKRGYFQITDRGLKVLAGKPAKINTGYLKRYPEFVEFQSPKKKGAVEEKPDQDDGATPEEEIEGAYEQLRESLANELIGTVKSCSPAFFEWLVIDLLLKMGYGGTRRDAGQAIGKSGDGGIDGIIKQDRLGLDVVYVQAKRWEGTVSRPEIQKFAGALAGKKAKRGVFITTSGYSKAAREYVSTIDSMIILIDGDTLAELMIDFDIGVTGFATYELKRVDLDYFVEG